ncbi:MAG: glycosyltransferase [Sulfitobacter sp.]
MIRTPVPVLVKRFLTSVRQDGVIRAVFRSISYVKRRVFGLRPSILLRKGFGRPGSDGKYLQGIWQTLAREDAFHILQSPKIHQKRRQIAMIADLNLPQCRKYRVEQLAGFWRARGVEFEFSHYQDVSRAARIMQQATHLMEYRLQASPAADMLRYEARRLRLPILYDLDDPLFSISAYETYRNMEMLAPAMKTHFLAEAPKYLSMMNGADVISVSTPGLATHAGLYSDRPIFLRRNFADTQTLRAGATAMRESQTGDGIFRVAFASGSQGHEADFNEILEPLTEFILQDPKRRLMLMGHFDRSRLPSDLFGQLETTKFSNYDRYLKILARADCAVMPLFDDVFNRCKSAVRVIDAAAVGVPSVVGPVGDLPSLVKDGETGFVAEATGWVSALSALAEAPERAQKMGLSARRNLETHWRASDQPHVVAPELIDWVES